MAKWRQRSDRANAARVRHNLFGNRYGLKPCPGCGRLNGFLSRTDDDRCSFGVGCRRPARGW